MAAICDRIASQYVEWQESSFPGVLGNVVAGRIANRLDLGGTSCVVDPACASSLSALLMAMNELELGHSDMVISGGGDALNDLFMYMCFSKTPAAVQQRHLADGLPRRQQGDPVKSAAGGDLLKRPSIDRCRASAGAPPSHPPEETGKGTIRRFNF